MRSRSVGSSSASRIVVVPASSRSVPPSGTKRRACLAMAEYFCSACSVRVATFGSSRETLAGHGAAVHPTQQSTRLEVGQILAKALCADAEMPCQSGSFRHAVRLTSRRSTSACRSSANHVRSPDVTGRPSARPRRSAPAARAASVRGTERARLVDGRDLQMPSKRAALARMTSALCRHPPVTTTRTAGPTTSSIVRCSASASSRRQRRPPPSILRPAPRRRRSRRASARRRPAHRRPPGRPGVC